MTFQVFLDTNLLHQYFLFCKCFPNVLLHHMSFSYLISFFMLSNSFFVISPLAYLLFRIVNESCSLLLDWLAFIKVTISHIISTQKSNIKINPNPIPKPIIP